VRLDRRRIKKLEAKRSKVEPVPDELLEAYYMALEDYQREQQGLPPVHQGELAWLDYDEELEGRPPPHPDPPEEVYEDS
jgi:hypothetical protein